MAHKEAEDLELMFKDLDRNLLLLFVIFLVLEAGYLISEYVITGHQFGVPLDDTWIHFRFAENFAHGHFFEYNIGEPTPGTTTPLWVIILSVPFLFSQNCYLTFSIAVSSLFLLLTISTTYKLCGKLGMNRNYSLLASLITLLAGRLLWSSLSAMEITSFCFLSIWIFIVHLREIENKKIGIPAGLLLGIAVNTRPEAYLLALLYFVVSIFLLKAVLKKNLGRLIFSFLIFAILAAPYPVFSYIHTGNFLPSTYEGQVPDVKYLPNITFMIESIKLFMKDNPVMVFLWFAAAIYFIAKLIKRQSDKKYLLLNLWIILLPLISSVIAPNWRHHGRYLIPLIPLVYIAGVNLLQKIFGYVQTKNYKGLKSIRRLSVACILIFSLLGTSLFAYTIGWNVENINDQQVNIGNWLMKNLPDEKAYGMNDIGAITFFTKKYVIDMAGLVTPEIFKIQKMSQKEGAITLFKLLKSKNVNYIIIYPDWFDYIMANYSLYFREVYSARLSKNTICGGIEMFVYKIDWDKLNLEQ